MIHPNQNKMSNNNLEHFQKMAEANGKTLDPVIANAFANNNQEGGDNPPPKGDITTDPPHNNNMPPDGDSNQDIDDATLLAALKKRNLNIDSLDALNSLNSDHQNMDLDNDNPEVKKAKIKEFAKTKQINAELLDKFESDKNKSSIEVAFQVYLNERKNENNEGTGEPYTEEELREEFEIEHNLTNDPESPVYKRSLRNLDIIKNIYLRDKYKDILNIESEFEADSNSRVQKANYEKEVIDAKSKLVEQGLTYSIKIPGTPDTDAPLEIKIPINANKLSEINVPIGSEDVVSEVSNQFVIKNIGQIMFEVANTYHAELVKMEAKKLAGIEHRKTEEYSKGFIVNEQFKERFEKAGIPVGE